MNSVRYIDGRVNTVAEVGKAGTDEVNEVRILVEKAAGGDVEAFGELYSIHLDRIYRYIFYQVNDRATAEDLTEEVFLKAWRSIGKFKWKGYPFSAWLYRIARNHAIDHFRTRQQHKSLEWEFPTGDDGPELKAEEKQMNRLISEAISSLPEQQKQLIILKFIEGMDNREIEQIMGKNQGAIRVMQMRALATLRQKLAGGIYEAA